MASSISSGKDGIIKLGGGGAELPKVTDWTITATGSSQATTTTTMLSYSGSAGSAGSSGSDGASWDVQEVTARAWTCEVTFFWQKTAAGASPLVDATDIGNQVTFELIPTLAPGYKWTGTAYISNVATVASTSTKIVQTLTLLGTGALTQSVNT